MCDRHRPEHRLLLRPLPPLRDLVERQIRTHLASSGREVDLATAGRAVEMLTWMWSCGAREGVRVDDWDNVAALPTTILAVLALVEQRR